MANGERRMAKRQTVNGFIIANGNEMEMEMEMNERHMRRSNRKENATLHSLSNRLIFALSYNFYYAALMAHHLDYNARMLCIGNFP